MRLLRRLFLLLTAAYWAGLCVLTHLPPQHLPHVGMNDKLEHFLAYGTLAGMLALTLWVMFPRRPWLAWTILVIGMAYGAVDEVTQPYFNRTCDIEDWIADAVGTITGILPVVLLQRFVRLPGTTLPAERVGRAAPPGENLGPELEAALDACCPPADAGHAGGNGSPARATVRRVR